MGCFCFMYYHFNTDWIEYTYSSSGCTSPFCPGLGLGKFWCRSHRSSQRKGINIFLAIRWDYITCTFVQLRGHRTLRVHATTMFITYDSQIGLGKKKTAAKEAIICQCAICNMHLEYTWRDLLYQGMQYHLRPKAESYIPNRSPVVCSNYFTSCYHGNHPLLWVLGPQNIVSMVTSL